MAVLIAAVVLVARWVARHPERVQAFADRQLSRPRVARLRAGQLAFLVRWLHPALGLSLTLTLLVLLAAGWAFAAVLEDVVARNELAIWDQPVAGFVLAHREPWLTTVMRAVTELGSPTVLAPLIAVIGLAWWRRTGSWRPLALLTAAGLGAWLLAGGIKLLIDRQRPPAATDLAGHLTGYAFPSGHATTAMAVYGMLAALLAAATPRWGRKVTAWAAALILALLVAASRVYLGAHWLTDVLGGLALSWASPACTSRSWTADVSGTKERPAPAEVMAGWWAGQWSPMACRAAHRRGRSAWLGVASPRPSAARAPLTAPRPGPPPPGAPADAR
ncbi:phosphatase PAP2 family protein [Carbonactinospora thermoautotrophica]|uniref:phosphatase PAP2 family protein n=1 Tax=Carbonactinospora thermoautotrophica TaxID=1469144 RepID=UPI003DA8086A